MNHDELTIMDLINEIRIKHSGRILKHQIIELAERHNFSPMHTILLIGSLKEEGRISEPIAGVYRILEYTIRTTTQQTLD